MDNDPFKAGRQNQEFAHKQMMQQQQQLQSQMMANLARQRQAGYAPSGTSRLVSIVVFVIIVGVVGFLAYSAYSDGLFGGGGNPDAYQTCIQAGGSAADCAHFK